MTLAKFVSSPATQWAEIISERALKYFIYPRFHKIFFEKFLLLISVQNIALRYKVKSYENVGLQVYRNTNVLFKDFFQRMLWCSSDPKTLVPNHSLGKFFKKLILNGTAHFLNTLPDWSKSKQT